MATSIDEAYQWLFAHLHNACVDCLSFRRLPFSAGRIDKLLEMKDSFAVRDFTLDGVVLGGVSVSEDEEAL